MEKINFVNNSAPYINADNLNAIQSSIENDLNKTPKIIYSETLTQASGTKTYDLSETGLYLVIVHPNGESCLFDVVYKYGNLFYKTSISTSPYINADYSTVGYVKISVNYTNLVRIIKLD